MQAITITQITPSELDTLIQSSVQKALQAQSEIQQFSESDPLLTIKQAGAYLSLSVPTLYGLVSKSGIPVSKRGKRLYFSKKELNEWVKAGRKLTLSEIDSKAASHFVKPNKKG